jgi:succinate dehydrogenase / fumarate reductase membrane anchor subunit
MARARGLGSAHAGLHHWIVQRVTAMASIPLMIWLALAIIRLARADYATFTAWLAAPWNAVVMILCVVVFFWHAILGNQVVIEDYQAHEGWKIVWIVAMKLVLCAAAAACIFSILKVAL